MSSKGVFKEEFVTAGGISLKEICEYILVSQFYLFFKLIKSHQ